MFTTCAPKNAEPSKPSRNKAVTDGASIEAAFTGRITDAGIFAADWQALRERLLDAGGIFLLRQFLSKAVGHETPALVAQYKDVIAGYLFKDAA